jgi:hypothetical protein
LDSITDLMNLTGRNRDTQMGALPTLLLIDKMMAATGLGLAGTASGGTHGFYPDSAGFHRYYCALLKKHYG